MASEGFAEGNVETSLAGKSESVVKTQIHFRLSIGQISEAQSSVGFQQEGFA